MNKRNYDDVVNEVKKIFSGKIMYEDFFSGEQVSNKEYTNACHSYCGRVFAYASFNSVDNVWIIGKDMDRVKEFLSTVDPKKILYILPDTFSILQFYAFKNEKAINMIKEHDLDYKKIENFRKSEKSQKTEAPKKKQDAGRKH